MSSAGGIKAIVHPSVFLDAGVLLSLFQFWDACKSVDADHRLHEISKWQDLEKALKSAHVDTGGLKQIDTISRGMTSFRRLTNSVEDYRHVSSRVCWAQVHHTLLEARGLEGLVHQRVPQSLRERRPQLLYRIALQESDYDELRDQIKEFRDSMKLDYGLDVLDVEDASSGLAITSGDIWNDAREIWSYVLMGVLEAYVCAAAARVGADVLVSDDPVVRDALGILNDPDRDWTALREALGTAPDAAFPRPLTPGAALPPRP